MKTSNKLLIGILIFTMGMVVVYNLLLGKAYKNGQLENQNESVFQNLKERPLKPFRHLVFDGALKFTDARGNPVTILTPRSLFIERAKNGGTGLMTSMKYSDVLDYRQHGDTLFISYTLKEPADVDGADFITDGFMTLAVTEPIASITANCGRITFGSYKQESPMKIDMANYSELQITGGSLRTLDLLLKDNSHGNANNGWTVDTLNYKLENNSALSWGYSLKTAVINGSGVKATDTVINASSNQILGVQYEPGTKF